MARRYRPTRLHIALGTLALALLISVPALAQDSITLSVTGEGRSAGVAGASLQEVGYSHDDQTSAGSISLSVDDSSATNAGWSVSVQAGDFSNGEMNIPAGNFAITGANGPVYVDGQEIDGAGGPMVPESGAHGSLDSPRKVLHAQENFGAGTYEQTLDVELLVPGQTPAGQYTSNLTVDITAGP